MNEQDKTPIFDSKEYAKQVSELISKIESRKLSKEQLKDAQKFGIADSVINQIFDNSNNNLNEAEQAQFIELLDKVLKAAPKREKNKIFKGSDNLKEALYLHNDNARREKLRK